MSTRKSVRVQNLGLALLSGALWCVAMVSGSTGFGSGLIWAAFVPLMIAVSRGEGYAETYLYLAISFLIGTGIYLALLSIQSWMYAFALLFPLILAAITALMWSFARNASPALRGALMILYVSCLDWGIASTQITATISPSITQADTIFLAPAGIAGFPLITALIVTVNTLAYHLLFGSRSEGLVFALAAAAVVAVSFAISLAQPSWRYQTENAVPVSALDSGMYPNGFHSPPERLAAERAKLPGGLYWELTEQGGDVVVWPEKFYPGDVLTDADDRQALEEAATDKTIIVPLESQNRNMAIPLTPTGFEEAYTKLRPATVIGEESAAGSEQYVYTEEDWRYGLVICFDMHFEQYSRGIAKKGAEAILVPSNSGAVFNSQNWVKRTAAVRAVEVGVPFVVATDIGSYIIDHRGRILEQSGGKTPAIITAEIMPNPTRTLYVLGGHYVRWAFAVLFVLLVLVQVLVQLKRRVAENRHSLA
jgi:apolipoprotein N-acyltransferase